MWSVAASRLSQRSSYPSNTDRSGGYSSVEVALSATSSTAFSLVLTLSDGLSSILSPILSLMVSVMSLALSKNSLI